MKFKQIKVKIQNGLLKPLEEVDFSGIQDAILIFAEPSTEDVLASLSGSLKDELPKEDSVIFINNLRNKLSKNNDLTFKTVDDVRKELESLND